MNKRTFEAWWKKNYGSKFDSLPGIMEAAWKEIAEKAWKASWEAARGIVPN